MSSSLYAQGVYYYYTHLIFKWGADAVHPDPSIYCTHKDRKIRFPSLNSFLNKEYCPCILIPFYSDNLKIEL